MIIASRTSGRVTSYNYKEEDFIFVINLMSLRGVFISVLSHSALLLLCSPYSSLGELPCVLFDIPDGHSTKQTVAQQQPMKTEQVRQTVTQQQPMKTEQLSTSEVGTTIV